MRAYICASGLDQRVRCVVRQHHRPADRRRHRQFNRPIKAFGRAQRCVDLFGLRLRLRLVYLFENDCELIAAKPRGDIRSADLRLHQLSGVHQRKISCAMPMLVVDQLHAVDVDKQHRSRRVIALGAGNALIEGGEKMATIEQRRQRITDRDALQLVIGDAQQPVFPAQRSHFSL